MVKRKENETPTTRQPGPKNRQSIISDSFKITRSDSPMKRMLEESEGRTLPSLLETNTIEPSPPILGGPPQIEGSIIIGGPPKIGGQVEIGGPPNITGPPIDEALALQNVGPIKSGGPTELVGLDVSGINLMASLPQVKGHLKVWNQFIDYLYPQLEPAEQAVHLQLYRLSWGFDKPTCFIGTPNLAKRAGVSRNTAAKAVSGLEKKGLIKKLGMKFGKDSEQGIEYWVQPAPAAKESSGPTKFGGPTKSGAIKESVVNKRHTQTQSGVSVFSRFTLEECRRYADHLKQTSQGITNPGGYATKIFRSGEADALIEAFLNPPVKIDPSQCPDCEGANFIYIDPLNRDRGVRPCKHERLKQG
jgi:DNA-binding Lrp family transcriptional regulator